jgi:hypothetical protein
MGKMIGMGICFVFIVLGILLIWGTIKKFSYLIDPPKEWYSFYSHAFIKKLLGGKFLILYNYFIGILFVLLGIIGLWNGLR